jgi:NADPH-dependent curcumin reductase CurA
MRAWVLRSRPRGLPQPSDFELAVLPDQPLGDGQMRVRNLWLSVDPYMRGRMNDVKSYVPPFVLGEPMQGGAVGEVVESNNPGFAPGDKVLHMAGWRDEAVIGAEAMPQKLPQIGVSDDTWLHNLGLTGGTAYFGLLRTAEAKAGDIVFVSAAAGAVGSAVVQIAKLKGMTVIGSAGGPDKVTFVKELGADACIDYKAGPVLPQLMEAAPKGIDVYFDNVGGEHLDAAFATARERARFAICGMIDVYNDGKPQELKYIIRTIPTRLTMRGFIWTDYLGEIETFQKEMGAWVTSGQIKARTTVREGLDQTLDAFLGLFSGANTGKMLVKL